MATIAPGLNFRIGADVKGINKAIREAEKSLRGAVSSFSSIGNSLSLALSAPLAAFGVMSVKAAGDMESLRLAFEGTMKDAGRSVQEAAIELDELRKAALAPGLDFEQAVKGSIRLQSVGFEAEQARKIVVELANALALSGGTADQLDGVAKQFTQIIGKGKIMQEDLSIILENMPILAKVMKDEFGTATAEGLRDLGVSAEDFVTRLTNQMSNLGRAQGGIANAIVNAQNAVRQALASVGEELNKTFNITGKLESFAKWVTDMAAAFRNLDDGTKRLVVGFAVFAAALGPAFKLMQFGVLLAGKLNIAFLVLQRTLAQSMAGQAIPSLIAKWKALDFAMKASVIGGIAAVVLAAAAAFAVLQKDMSATAVAARAVNDVTKQGEAAVSRETAEIRLLSDVVKDNTKTKEERRAALDKLIAISPDYRKALKGEAIDTVELDKVTAKLISTLVRAATVRQATERIAEIDNELRNLKDTSDPTFWQTAGNYVMSFGNSWGFVSRQVGSAIGNMEENKKRLEAEKKALEDLAKANFDVATATTASTGRVKEQATAAKAAAEQIQAVAKIQSFGQLPTLDLMPEVLQSQGEDPFRKIADSIRIATSEMRTHLTVAGQAAKVYENIRAGSDNLIVSLQSLAESLIANGQIMSGVIVTAATGMAESAAKGASSLKEFAQAALGSAAKVIRAWIQMAVTRAALSALQSLPFPFNIAAATAAGGIAAVLFNSLIKKVGIPALAEGGVLTSPRLVMAGEYAGARTNPEIVTPENKMRDVVGEVLARSGGFGGNMMLTTRLAGDDILFVVERAQNKKQRKS